ncbi:MAG: threonine synthase [Terriglobales bacterium]
MLPEGRSRAGGRTYRGERLQALGSAAAQDSKAGMMDRHDVVMRAVLSLPSMRISYLECTRCGEHLSADRPQNLCPKDGGILYVRYDLASLKGKLRREDFAGRVTSMWRYAEVLPDARPVTLGEGFTPMLPSREHPNLYIKDEGLNPTGSFKARGMSAAVSMATHYGLKKLAAPSAGNAGGALAAYAAAAGSEAHVFMPRDVPIANRMECDYYGAHVTLVDGLISDCGRMVAERKDQEGWFDVSTLKEPFRLEGKKTMGYEVAEQLGWELPQGIIYPTGGGVGMIGMWKAFAEMEELGWIGSERPKMVTVQAAGCAPIVKAWEEGKTTSEMWTGAETFAAGLRVPKAYGDYLILEILKRSQGAAVAATDEEILAATRHWASVEGVFAAPEGAASLVAYQKLRARGFFRPADTVVLFNTGSAYKYLDMIEGQAKKAKPETLPSRSLGGIIGPY